MPNKNCRCTTECRPMTSLVRHLPAFCHTPGLPSLRMAAGISFQALVIEGFCGPRVAKVVAEPRLHKSLERSEPQIVGTILRRRPAGVNHRCSK